MSDSEKIADLEKRIAQLEKEQKDLKAKLEKYMKEIGTLTGLRGKGL